MSASIEHAIQNAEVSLQMEGFTVREESKALCRKLLAGEITLEQYLALVIANRKDS